MARPITMRRSLVISFVLVVCALSLVLLGATFFTTRSEAELQAARLIERKLREIQRSGQQHFQPVESILTFASAWRTKANCSTDADLQAIFDTLVTASPQIAAVRIEPFDVFQAEDFEDDAVRWTKPYMLAGAFGLGMSAYTPVALPSGTSALVAVDVPLDVISRFTMAYDVTPRTRVITMYRQRGAAIDGKGGVYSVVGLPREERFEDPAQRQQALLRLVRDIDLPYVTDALAAYRARRATPSTEPLAFRSGGERWWAGFREYALDKDIHMADAVFVPEQDLLGETARFRLFILGATAIALLLAIMVAIALARRAGRPIEALVSETDRIRRGDFSPGTPIDTPIDEVRRLAEAHEEMRLGLEQLTRMEYAMGVARNVQQKTFPTRMPLLPGYALFGSSLPAEDTGGDTYDVIGVRQAAEKGHDELTEGDADVAVLLLADATGHGIGPALSVSQVRAMLRMAVRLETDLTGVVREINEQLRADLPSGRFITAWFGILDPSRHTLTTFSAGQGPILIYRAATDSFDRSVADAPPLGLMDIRVDAPAPTVLEPGDLYIVLSDGFHEAASPERELYGEERVEALVRARAGDSPEELLAALHAAVDAFTQGAPPDDDRTGVIIKRVARA